MVVGPPRTTEDVMLKGYLNPAASSRFSFSTFCPARFDSEVNRSMAEPGSVESSFAQSSAADRNILPPEPARWPIWPWIVLAVVLLGVVLVRAGRRQQAEAEPGPPPVGVHHPAVGVKLTSFR